MLLVLSTFSLYFFITFSYAFLSLTSTTPFILPLPFLLFIIIPYLHHNNNRQTDKQPTSLSLYPAMHNNNPTDPPLSQRC